MSEYVELSVSVDRELAARVSELFEEQGAYSVTVKSTNDEECFDVASPTEPSWQEQTLTGLFEKDFNVLKIEHQLNQELGISLAVHQKILRDKDWERVWSEGFKPFEVGNKFRICPSWMEADNDTRICLTIDPGMAFGTGTHETTFSCLEALSEIDLEGKTVVDFGCGTGILGIAASKLGAANVHAIDIDERAVLVAQENAELNNVTGSFIALHNNDFFLNYSNLQCDFLVANILANTLIELSDIIKNLIKQNGILMMSGILHKQSEDVRAEFNERFSFSQFQKNDWVVLLGKPRG